MTTKTEITITAIIVKKGRTEAAAMIRPEAGIKLLIRIIHIIIWITQGKAALRPAAAT